MTKDTQDPRALVERLLWLEAKCRGAGRIIAEDFKEAAAALTAAQDEIERLREVLTEIEDAFGCECGDMARAALKGDDQ